MKISTSYIHGTPYQFPKTSFQEFLNLPVNMGEFQPIPTYTKFLPGINQNNLVVKNLTLETSLWMELSQHRSSEMRIFSSDIKDPMMISKSTKNGLHICQPMEANVLLLLFGNEFELLKIRND